MARPIEKRDCIVKGVIEVVSRKGLHATTIQDIASAGGVSPGLLYRYWKDRDALAAEAYLAHYDRVLALVGERVERQRGFWARVRAMVETVLEFADQEPETLRFLLLSQHDLAPLVSPQKTIHFWLAQLISAGLAEGQVRGMDERLAVQLVVGLVLQPIIGSHYGRVETPLRRHGEEILRAIRRVLEPEE